MIIFNSITEVECEFLEMKVEYESREWLGGNLKLVEI
jgi:hypothetical protein